MTALEIALLGALAAVWIIGISVVHDFYHYTDRLEGKPRRRLPTALEFIVFAYWPIAGLVAIIRVSRRKARRKGASKVARKGDNKVE